ncbi:MAG TPA: hypothetical protein VLE21_02810 [Candidatus Nitrosocosmicus sp.]|nr:hypothetical protein [Candidatus Nitrosocosmicus sp.]
MDLKNLLYAEINRMGSLNIKRKIMEKSENSKYIIEELMKNCLNSLNRNILLDSEWVSICEALMHYMLTVMVLPSQRKITIDGFEVSVVIPNARNIYKNLEQVIIIQFYIDEDNTIKNIVDKLKSIQPIMENIWIVSYLSIDMPNPLKNYVISDRVNVTGETVFPFSRIILDVAQHLEKINYSGFKIL